MGIRWEQLRLTARVLIIIAIVFWLWFGIGSAYVEGAGPVNWLMHILAPGGIFILSALVAWRWQKIGGALLVLQGLAALGFIVRAFLRGNFTASTLVLTCLTLALPPLTAGILLWLSCASLDSSTPTGPIEDEAWAD